jgi:hypothetical protein
MPDHSHVGPGQQCRCGLLNIGITRAPESGRRNDLQWFMEEWTHIDQMGCDPIVFQEAPCPNDPEEES